MHRVASFSPMLSKNAVSFATVGIVRGLCFEPIIDRDDEVGVLTADPPPLRPSAAH